MLGKRIFRWFVGYGGSMHQMPWWVLFSSGISWVISLQRKKALFREWLHIILWGMRYLERYKDGRILLEDAINLWQRSSKFLPITKRQRNSLQRLWTWPISKCREHVWILLSMLLSKHWWLRSLDPRLAIVVQEMLSRQLRAQSSWFQSFRKHASLDQVSLFGNKRYRLCWKLWYYSKMARELCWLTWLWCGHPSGLKITNEIHRIDRCTIWGLNHNSLQNDWIRS
jgi:hypothetical protein